MSQTHYPFTNTSFKAHEVAIYALGAVLVLIATTIGWVLWEPTVALPQHMAMTMAGGSLVFFLVWIFLLSTFDAKKTAARIQYLEYLENILLNMVHVVDTTTMLDPAQKRAVLETYIELLKSRADEPASKQHLKHVSTRGFITALLVDLDREAAAEAIEKIKENGGRLPHQQIDLLNYNSGQYSMMKDVITRPA